MADERDGDDGRWDVAAKDGAVHVERRGEDNEQVFTDRLTPEDARQLAALLTKFADKAASAGEGESAKRDDADDDSSDDRQSRSESKDDDSDDDEDSDDDSDDDSDEGSDDDDRDKDDKS
ncbi:hypothetical protein E4P42_15655 [Mycobacterium sp. PS03-16]|uniref:hypothetical protein n=1 Tax=Mycobacterium sp. PS03-16 TaxID=2559611 RepID=UPI001073459A|nr:hypothetical protein [Mycobacterium sp. PS03-16]TFV57336.1 hypothetical protein E4P42_15655 [Mycobacterium sp. PS03-16]